MAARGDTLLSVRAPVGEVNIAAEATCIGRGLASIRSTDGSPNTLFHLLRDEPSIWAPYEAEGTVFGSINRAQLEGLQVPVVDDAMGGELEDRLDAIERRVACALLENDHIAAARDALLPALMSGKLRVRDAERAVEQVV
jgi:type I restriction enzyme S subunit